MQKKDNYFNNLILKNGVFYVINKENNLECTK